MDNKQLNSYMILSALVISGLATATVTASKIIHIGINFPFCNIVFSILTYPMVDCICEIWGKKLARQTVWIALGAQLLIVIMLQISIAMPHAAFWHKEGAYDVILASSKNVIAASLIAFIFSQILDIIVYQKLKNVTEGKFLWLRSNLSTFIGQVVDSSIFIGIVFYGSNHIFTILSGSIIVKLIISVAMTPFVYLVVFIINRYLGNKTLAFKSEPNLITS